MNQLQLIIETNENYKETTLFPWIEKSKNNIIFKFDVIPIKYFDKIYLISLIFPYNYNYIHLQYKDKIFKLNLIHNSNELNLCLFECEKYNGFHYTLNNLKYKIPSDKFDDFIFINNDTRIKVQHIDYFFKNYNSDLLPPLAYLNVQSESVYISSVLYNDSNDGIYGIVKNTEDHHILIPAIAIKRLLDGTKFGFVYSNFYCDYELNNKCSITILKSYYKNIKINSCVTEIDDLIIINGKIKYNKINEWVPIEVYLWYEWLNGKNMNLKLIQKNRKSNINLEFIDFTKICSIPFRSTNNLKILTLSFELLDYFYDKNIILYNKKINNKLLNLYENKDNILIEINDKLIINKYEEPTQICDFLISII